MAKLTAAEFQEKHARRLKASLPDITKGVQRVTEAPGVKAAAKQDKMLAKITEAVTSGKWGNRVAAVSVEEWRKKTLDKGIGRISGGIDAAKQKTIDFAQQLLPAVDAAVAEVKGMADLTLEDNIARMVAYTRKMSQFKKT